MFSKLKINKFYSASLIFFIASLFGALGNYVFHSLSARLLAPAAYGELQSLIALSIIFGIPVGVFSTVIIKYTAEFKAKNENSKIYFLFKNFTKKLFFLGIFLAITLLTLSWFIFDFLALTSPASMLILIAGYIFVFLAALNNSILQGLRKFADFSLISVVGVILKIILAFVLIKLSLAVFGAITAIVISGLAAYGLTFIPLNKVFKSQQAVFSSIALPTRQMFLFSGPVFFSLLFTTMLYNLDIILVKHFFTAELAGHYAALALIGHIIFFIVGPLAAVMFPFASAARATQKQPNFVLKKSLGMSVFIGLAGLIIYFLCPNLIIKIIVGANYLNLAPYLGWFGLSMLLFSLISLLSQHFLSINRLRFIYILGFAVFLQILFIALWHQNLWQIIWTMNFVMGLCLASLCFYYSFSAKHQNTKALKQ